MEEKMHLGQGSKHPGLKVGSLRIYSMRFCPYAQRALLVAEAKGIKYDVENINLTTKPEWFLALNPRGQVPTLEFEDGTMLPESLIVSDYLDDKYPERALYPSDPLKKANDRLLIDRFSELVGMLFRTAMQLGKPESELDLSFFENLVKGIENYEKELVKRGTLFFGGSTPGMVDYMIWPTFERNCYLRAVAGDKTDIFHNRFPQLKRWRDGMMEDGAVKKWFVSPEAHVRYIKSYISNKHDYDFLVQQ